MKKMVKKAAIATLVMGTSMVSMVGISFATTTVTPPPSTTISGATWYQVSTAGELEYIDQNQSTYLSANIELMNNVDLTGYSWVPLGSRTYDASTHSLLAFSGTFNGKGYGLSNVNVNEPSASNVGIFGASTGTIENLHVSGSVSGSNNVGGLVGFQDGGIIVDSFATNSVSGSDSVGGLVGSQNSSSITDSYATGSVSGSDNDTGGLVGSQNGGSLTDSYATGSVSGYLDVGSLVGAQGGSITDSYATGKVSGTGFLGGFLGSQIDSSITDSYFDPQSTDQSSGVGFSQTATGTPTPTTGTQWNTPATFTGWDFTNTWGIDPLLNHGYPYLLALKSSYYAQPLDISPTVQAGTTMGSSMVTSTPNTSGDTLEYAISAGPLSPPPLNSTPPNGLQTSGVLSPVKVGDYVGVYELNAQNQVVAFSQIGPLTSPEVDTVNAAAPMITTSPSSQTVIVGQPASLTVSASVNDGGTLSYQWYSSTSNSNSGGMAIPNATSATYTPSTSTVATMYYYVVVTNTNPNVNGQTTATYTSPAVPVTVNPDLIALTVSGVPLNFLSSHTFYGGVVPSSTSSVVVTPTPGDSQASVTVNSVALGSGQTSATIPLSPGENPITITVTLNGNTTTYHVLVARAIPISMGLTHTQVTPTSWTESWNAVPGAVNYMVTVNGTPLQTKPTTQTSVDFTNMIPGTTYHIVVYAIVGDTGFVEDSDTVTTPASPLTGQLPEVPLAGGLPVMGLAGAGVLWFTRRRKGKQA